MVIRTVFGLISKRRALVQQSEGSVPGLLFCVHVQHTFDFAMVSANVVHSVQQLLHVVFQRPQTRLQVGALRFGVVRTTCTLPGYIVIVYQVHHVRSQKRAELYELLFVPENQGTAIDSQVTLRGFCSNNNIRNSIVDIFLNHPIK